MGTSRGVRPGHVPGPDQDPCRLERVDVQSLPRPQLLPDALLTFRPQLHQTEQLQFLFDPQEVLQVGLGLSFRHPIPLFLSLPSHPILRQLPVNTSSLDRNREFPDSNLGTVFYTGNPWNQTDRDRSTPRHPDSRAKGRPRSVLDVPNRHGGLGEDSEVSPGPRVILVHGRGPVGTEEGLGNVRRPSGCNRLVDTVPTPPVPDLETGTGVLRSLPLVVGVGVESGGSLSRRTRTHGGLEILRRRDVSPRTRPP